MSGAAGQLTQAAAPPTQEPPASIVGTTTTAEGTVPLPGVQVSLIDPATGAVVANTSSDENGSFSFSAVAPALYRVGGRLEGFRDATSGPLQVRAGQQTPTRLDLPVANSFEEHITVAAPANLAATTALPAESVRVEDIRMFQPVSTQGDIQNVLALMPGAVQGPGGGPVSINGGRPTQTRVLLDGMSIVDPITGRADIDLPSDGIEAVQILPDPSGGEYGRLSAGVIQFQTRQAPTKLTFTMSNFVPEPLFRQEVVNGPEGVHGVRDFAPQLFVGGPLIKNRVFIAESLLFEYYIPRVYGVEELPTNETTRTKLTSVTRIDVVVSPTHFATFNVDFGPRKIDQLGVGLFVAPSATPSESVNPFYVSGAERTTIGRVATVESAVAARNFSTSVTDAGNAPMVISPEGRTGNFFNTQQRDFQTLQWKETVTASATNWTGTHLFKVGSDVLYGSYTGTDVSRPIELERLDGTLAETVDFARPSSQSAAGTDGAIFVDDAWVPVPRVKIEPSLRIERDAMIGETNVAPRASMTVGVNASGTAVVHAGLGRFYERTPLLARSFTSFEPVVITQFATNGVDQAGAPVTWTPTVAPELHDASSFIWNAGYDQRLGPHWQISSNVLERRGSHDLIVDPVAGPTGNSLLLDSSGQSQYKELSLWAEFTRGPVHTSASYVWSNATGDLNTLDSFYGTFRNAIIRPDEYGPTDLDVPHRLVWWSSVPGPWGLTFSDVLQYRTGFPYSAVDAYQQYVGPANSLRFPNVFTVDLNVFHEVKIASHAVRLIMRIYNVLNTFNPLEIQNNVTAPDFGTAYSHVERRLALDFDLIR
jgi:hypothetical protein